MGRFLSDSSPVMVTSMSHGATMPMSRRAVVPELPQSMGAAGLAGALGAPAGDGAGKRSVGWAFKSTSAPKASTARMEARTSSESSTPERCEVPSAMAANSTARCEMDLSPGTVTSPLKGPPKGSMIV